MKFPHPASRFAVVGVAAARDARRQGGVHEGRGGGDRGRHAGRARQGRGGRSHGQGPRRRRRSRRPPRRRPRAWTCRRTCRARSSTSRISAASSPGARSRPPSSARKGSADAGTAMRARPRRSGAGLGPPRASRLGRRCRSRCGPCPAHGSAEAAARPPREARRPLERRGDPSPRRTTSWW